MTVGRGLLKATSALPLVLAALGGALAATPALADCTTSGTTTTCGTATPNPYTGTVGTGPGDHGRTVDVEAGASIQVVNRNAISLGNNARINLAAGSLVRTDATGGSGLYGTGPQPIEFGSNGILVVAEGAQVISRGTQGQAEAVNVHGFGNRIENHGLISGQASAAIWFEDWTSGAKNVVDNYGTIEQVNGGTVIGAGGGSGIDFYNRSGAVVSGSLRFAAGDDDLYFFAGSTVTGAIDGGAGTNSLTLEGAAGTSDSLAGALTNFQSLTKEGLGLWTITGTLAGFQSTTVNLGTLALTGDNTGYSAGVLVNPLGTLEARAQSLPTTAANLNNVVNDGRVRFAQDDTGTYEGQIVGSGVVQKTGAGTTTLAPTAGAGNTYAGGTEIDEGALAVAADSALGAATGGVSFDGGTLRTTATFAMARPMLLEDGGGTLEPMAGTTLTETGTVSGAGRLTKIGAGTLVLGAANSYEGGTQIDAGTVQVGSDANLGAAAGDLEMNGGTLRSTATFAMARETTLGAAGGTFETQTGTLSHAGAIGGTGALTKTGAGTLTLGGSNAYAGGTVLDAGIVEIRADANLGAAAGTLTFGGGTLRSAATIATSRATTLAAGGGTFDVVAGTTLTHGGSIGGADALRKAGAGTLVLTGDANHAGGTTIAAGRLQIGDGGTGGTLAGDVVDNGVLAFDRSDAIDAAGTISGTGALVQAGSGVTRLTGDNAYAGTTTVESGALYVDGDQTGATGATIVQSGGTLGGTGTIGGDVTIADGATLSPGDVGSAPGTLVVNGDLQLGSGSFVAYGLGQANVAGGALNDLTVVGGDLVLDGTLNVALSPGGVFAPGIYRVFDYAGALTDNGLQVGTIPSPDFFVQTSVANQVNLVNAAGTTLDFWDGNAGPKDDGVIDGGDGTWQSSAGNDNWTDANGAVNAPFRDGSFAIFQGEAGTVTVDNGLGAVTVGGMQFATDGYLVTGDALTLTGAPSAIVRVGDGGAGSGGVTATIAAELTGASRLVKTDLGTLVLSGANTYTGGTAMNGGVVQVAGDGNLGAAAGSLGFDGGTLRTTATFTTGRDATLDAGGGTIDTATGTLTTTGTIGGAGALTKTGAGTLVLAGANDYAGGTVIEGGTVVAAADESLGAGALAFDGGTLRASASFAMDRDVALRAGGGTLAAGSGVTLTETGDISGAGGLTKTGVGTVVLSGDGGHTGGTTIAAGTLRVGDGGTTGSLAGDVENDGTLAFDRSDALDLAGKISGDGRVVQEGTGKTTLSGVNSYSGGTSIVGGTLSVSTDANLGDAAGPLAISGATLETTAGFATARATALAASGGTFDTAAGTLAHSGAISGLGGLTKAGSGTLRLSGKATYTGATTVAAGTLAAGAAGALATGSAHAVSAEGTLDLDSFDQRVARLSNAGRVTLGQVPGTTLDVAGDYVGQGGVLHFATALGGDASVTDRLTIGGDASGTGRVEVTNAGGFGAPTTNGIKLVDIAGASDATFTLVGDTVFGGRPVVIAGAYAYSLWQGGVSTPSDGDWYLRSQSTIQPGAPQVQPGVPTYEGYPLTLLALNGLPTMQERVGNRYWTGSGTTPGFAGLAAAGTTVLPAGGASEDRRAWMRVEGSRIRLSPDGDLIGTPDYDMDVWKLQVGMDGQLHETEDAVLVGGITFTTGSVSTDVSSDSGNGSIDSDGYGLGATLTWLRDDDLYVDGQAQAMWYDSDLSTDASGSVASGNDGFGYAAGVEVGKRIDWRDDWTLTPQAQLVYSSVDFDDFDDPFNVRVEGDEGATMPLRVGLAVDQERAWKAEGKGDARRSHVYGIANVYYDFLDGTEVRVGGDGLTTDVDRLWGSLGIGGTYGWADGAYAVYGEGLVRTSLDDFGESYANTATVGFRMAW